MTKIGAICLVTIGLWGVLELGVMFGGYRHACSLGPRERARGRHRTAAFGGC
jgi:hypothetical protein